jgi:hypothetical protein
MARLAVGGDGEIAAFGQGVGVLEVGRYARGLTLVAGEGDPLALGEGHGSRLPEGPCQAPSDEDDDADDDACPLGVHYFAPRSRRDAPFLRDKIAHLAPKMPNAM